MNLSDDKIRCRDNGCSERGQCLRWLCRDSGTDCLPSLFPYDIPLSEPCPLRIPPDQGTADTG